MLKFNVLISCDDVITWTYPFHFNMLYDAMSEFFARSVIVNYYNALKYCYVGVLTSVIQETQVLITMHLLFVTSEDTYIQTCQVNGCYGC